jgi:hypothetical protein
MFIVAMFSPLYFESCLCVCVNAPVKITETNGVHLDFTRIKYYRLYSITVEKNWGVFLILNSKNG